MTIEITVCLQPFFKFLEKTDHCFYEAFLRLQLGAQEMSKTYSAAAVCDWNTHIGVTSGRPSAHVLLILKSNRSSVPFPLARTHESQI